MLMTPIKILMVLGNLVILNDYMVEFDQRYQKSVKHQMTLPDAVLAFKLLDNANLRNHERKLALTACTDPSYDKMKSAMKRIFGQNRHSEQNKLGVLFVQLSKNLPCTLNIEGQKNQEIAE